MLFSRHFELGICGEVITTVTGETCGAPTIHVSIDLPAKVQWTPNQDEILERLFEEVRVCVIDTGFEMKGGKR